MSRLVVVSNRTADPRKPAAGGLAVAVKESLQQTGGVWFGWSGRLAEDAGSEAAHTAGTHVQPVGNVTLATLDLSREDYETYYLGYANDVRKRLAWAVLDVTRVSEAWWCWRSGE